MNKLYLLIFSYIVFVTYNLYVIFNYGIHPSISASYYSLKKQFKPLFTLFIWLFIFPIMIVGESGLMFMGGGLVSFVGASPNFDVKQDKSASKQEELVHKFGAIFGISLAMLSLLVDFNMIYSVLTFIVITLILILFKIKNTIFWIEIVAFSTIFGSLLYNII